MDGTAQWQCKIMLDSLVRCKRSYPLFITSKAGDESAKNVDIINYFWKNENVILKLFVVVMLR